MNLADFIRVLETAPGNRLRLVLPGGADVPAQFHITEVGHAVKRFVDCGGTVRSEESCLLQVWIDPNDADHRIEAGKLARILRAATVIPGDETPVEFDHETTGLCRYTLSGYDIADGHTVFRLENKHADCLAKDICAAPVFKIGARVTDTPGCGCGPTGCC